MKKTTRLFVACTGLLAFAGSSLGFADDRAGAFTLRFGEGYYYFASKRHLDNTSIPNFDVGYDITDQWGIQAGAAIINTQYRGAYGSALVHGFIYSVDTVYHFTQFNTLKPYALGGVGVTSLKPNGNDATHQGNVNVGVGVQYFIHNDISLGLEARDVYTLQGGKNDVMLTAGIRFLFGGSTPEVESTYKK